MTLESESKRKDVVVGVDDDFRVRESIASLVESAGYVPMTFASAEEFLLSGGLTEANCVITDVRMPGMGGLEMARRLRVLRPELPVILISAHYDDGARQRALKDGAIEFLYKPFDAGDLLKAVEAALTGSQGHPGLPGGKK